MERRGDHAIVVDLGFGDAGKGTVVDWLCSRRAGRTAPEFHAVVRFNGGAQAAHNVVTTDRRHHTFAQFGSGTFTPGVRTHLSRYMLVDPLALAVEADHLAALGVTDAFDRLTVDGEALLTTPYHRAANRAREIARGAGRHGSCGKGIGETVAYALVHDDAPRVVDCLSPARLRRRLTAVRDHLTAELGSLSTASTTGDTAARTGGPHPGDLPHLPGIEGCVEAFTAFAERVRVVDESHLTGLLRTGGVVFEGAQGVLLDEWHGFHPYTTWSTTTFTNAEKLLAGAGASATRIGVLRAYATRHGPGPLVTEDPALTATLPDPHNVTDRWQGGFRVGHLDLVALRYAVEVAEGVDELAVTHLDVAVARDDLRLCRAYEMSGGRVDRLPVGPPGDLDRQARLTESLLAARPLYDDPPPADWSAAIEEALGAPVTLRSYGPTTADKRHSPHCL